MFKFNELGKDTMSGLEHLNKRLQYQGGNAENRFINDKLKTLKKSLLYSYQAATAVLSDGRKFRCLINPDKETSEYDNKIISIPYKDKCLNIHKTELAHRIDEPDPQEEVIGLKCGDVFEWEETHTHWLVYLEFLEEDAYFRAQIRKCEQQTEIGNKKYWTYIRGPVETSVQWRQKGGVEWNDLNYSLVMYVTRDDNTAAVLHRFSKLKIFDPLTNTNKTWSVAAVDPYYGDGIIEVMLDEYFENTAQDKIDAERAALPQEKPVKPSKYVPYIKGPAEVKGYSKVEYTIENISDRGLWFVDDGDNIDLPRGFENNDVLKLTIMKKRGKFTIKYKIDDEIVATKEVTIISV